MAHPANLKPAMVIITTSPEALDKLEVNFSQPIGTLSAAKFQVTIISPAILSDFHQHRNFHADGELVCDRRYRDGINKPRR